MKQFKHIFVFALLLACFNVQAANAQSFWKKLGKAAGKVLDATSSSSSSSSSNSSSSSSSTKKSAANGYIPNVDFKVTKCEYWGSGVLVRFVVTNNTSDDLEMIAQSYRGEAFEDNIKNCVAYDENNNAHQFAVFIDGENLYYNAAKLPSGVPVKGYIDIENITPGTKMINSVTFSGWTGKNYYTNNRDYTYKVGPQTITYANNTNKDNIFLTLPFLAYNYTKAYRSGNDIVLEGTLTNNNTSNYNIHGNSDSKAYDSEGNIYDISFVVGTSTYGTDLTPDVPIKSKIVVKGVPSSIHKFNLVKVVFDSNNGYYLQFKNLAF